jgi:hypothetical protein
MAERIDSTGRQFGSYVVERMVWRPFEKTLAVVRCVSCGRRTRFRASHLRSGRVRQCCALAGRVFGFLEVLVSVPNVPSGTRHLPSGHSAFRARCRACGREVIVERRRLMAPRHPKLHCGCRSKVVLPSAPASSTAPPVDVRAVPAAPTVPLKTTSAQAALDREADVLRPFAVTAGSRVREPDDVDYGRALLLDDVANNEEY